MSDTLAVRFACAFRSVGDVPVASGSDFFSQRFLKESKRAWKIIFLECDKRSANLDERKCLGSLAKLDHKYLTFYY